MKKIVFILMMLMPMVVNAKKTEYEIYIDKPIYNNAPVFENDSVRIEFTWHYTAVYVRVGIWNKTNSRMYVEWENARIGDDMVNFETDTRFSYQNPKADELIHSGSSTYKRIASRVKLENGGSEFFRREFLKEFGSFSSTIIIPIRFPTETKDYKIVLGCRKKVR